MRKTAVCKRAVPVCFQLGIVFVMILFCCISVYADDTSLGRTPDGVFPMQENDVIMESEEITVDLDKNSVECIFVFHNTGTNKNVYMGFPGKINALEDELTSDVNLEISNFKTFIDAKEIRVTHQKSIPNTVINSDNLNYSEYFTFTVPFKANEKLKVRNTYDFIPTYDSIGDVFSGYVLKTGALWKGLIGSAKVTFKLGKIKPYQLENLKPEGFRFEGDNLIWQKKNFEPDYDLEVDYNTYHYSEEFLKDEYTTPDQIAEITQKINSFNNVKKLASRRQYMEMFFRYFNAIRENDDILALYIKGFLTSK